LNRNIILPLILLPYLLLGCNLFSRVIALVSSAAVSRLSENTIDEIRVTSTNTPTGLDTYTGTFRAGLITEQQHILQEMDDLTRYDICVEISYDYSTLSGNQTVHYTNREEQDLAEVYFRLFPNANGAKMLVTNMLIDGQPGQFAYEYDETAIRVTMPHPLIPGSSIDLSMDFDIDIPRVMGGNYGLFGYFDHVLVLDEFYPVIPVYDDEGWNVEDSPHNGDLTFLDQSYYIVRVTAPRDLVIVSSGNSIDISQANNEQAVTFSAGPSRDFYLAGSNEFIRINQNIGETKVSGYALNGYELSAGFALDVAADSLRCFNQRFGTYPYTEYDIASTPMKALGMEYPGVSGIGISLYAQYEADGSGPSSSLFESIIAHETGHQWFYSLVGSDQVDEPWMDEAIVQYITGLYFLDTHGMIAEEMYQRSWSDRWDNINFNDIPIGLPSSRYTGTDYTPIIYGRGPIFLRVLAGHIGQETMDTALKEYFQTNVWGIGDAVSFKQIVEKHCHCDLTPLFDEWIYP